MGYDPPDVRHADRILCIQLKGIAAPGVVAEGGWAATGDGVIRWDEFWRLFKTTRAEYLVVEHDDPFDWSRREGILRLRHEDGTRAGRNDRG